MEFITGFVSTIFSIIEMFFWYLLFFVNIGLFFTLLESTKQKHFSKVISSIIYGVLILMTVFPPWYKDVAGLLFSEGYHFISSYRYTEGMFINIKRLLIQYSLVLIVGVAAQVALSSRRGKTR